MKNSEFLKRQAEREMRIAMSDTCEPDRTYHEMLAKRDRSQARREQNWEAKQADDAAWRERQTAESEQRQRQDQQRQEEDRRRAQLRLEQEREEQRRRDEAERQAELRRKDETWRRRGEERNLRNNW